MTDEQTTDQTKQTESTGPSLDEAWNEVGQHFQALGESLATAFRTAWQRVENRQYLEEVQTSLETAADKVSQAVKEAVTAPEMEQVREEVEKVAQSARSAGEQTLQEVRPHLLSTLHQLKGEVEKMISHLEAEEPSPAKPPATESTPEGQGDTE